MTEVRLWVHPNFKKKLKKEAADKEISVVKLTEELADDSNKMLRKIKNGKKAFSFRI